MCFADIGENTYRWVDDGLSTRISWGWEIPFDDSEITSGGNAEDRKGYTDGGVVALGGASYVIAVLEELVEEFL